MSRPEKMLFLMLGLLIWPILCPAQQLQTEDRQQLQFPSLRGCSEERSRIVLRVRQGTVSREAASGSDVSIRVSPAGDRIVFVLGRAECRIAGMIYRPHAAFVDDIASVVSMSAREAWPEMDGDVQMLPPVDGCMDQLVEYSLLPNFVEQIVTNFLPQPASAENSCFPGFIFGPLS